MHSCKLFGTTGPAGGFRFTIKKPRQRRGFFVISISTIQRFWKQHRLQPCVRLHE